MILELTIILATLVFITYVYFKYSHTYWKKLNVPYIEPSFPFGNMADVILRRKCMGDKIKEIYDSMKKKHCKYVGLYFFSRKAFLPLDPALIKNILATDFHYFNDRGIYYDEDSDPLSAHLFSLSGPKWKNLRTKLTPAYSPGKLKYMFNTISQCGNQMIEILRQRVNSEKTIEVKDIFARYSTDVIGTCAFGLECNTMKNPDAEFRRMGRRAFTQTVGDVFKVTVIRSFPTLARLFGLGIFAPSVTNFFMNVVDDTIRYRERNGITRNDFLQLLIQLKNNGQLDGDVCDSRQKDRRALTTNEAAAQAFIFFLAGFETTSATTSFTLFEMAVNSNIQQKAREEVKGVLKRHNGQLTYEAVMEMQYLETVILESLRKYPPAPVFLRKCTKPYPVPDSDVIIEEGMTVLIPAYGMHRDPEYFSEPELFDPERFNAENKGTIPDYTYIPFGDGPRICIGMRFAMIQVKIALSLILHNFEFGLNQQTKLPLVMEKKGIIITPIGGIWMNFKSIEHVENCPDH